MELDLQVIKEELPDTSVLNDLSDFELLELYKEIQDRIIILESLILSEGDSNHE